MPLIEGINHNLNGSDESQDFWEVGIALHDDGTDSGYHKTRAVPEPFTAVLLGLGLIGLAINGRRRRG